MLNIDDVSELMLLIRRASKENLAPSLNEIQLSLPYLLQRLSAVCGGSIQNHLLQNEYQRFNALVQKFLVNAFD